MPKLNFDSFKAHLPVYLVALNAMIMLIICAKMIYLDSYTRSEAYLESTEIVSNVTAVGDVVDELLKSRIAFYKQMVTSFYHFIYFTLFLAAIAILILSARTQYVEIEKPFERRISTSVAALLCSIACTWAFVSMGYLIDKVVDERKACWELCEAKLETQLKSFTKSPPVQATKIRKSMGAHPTLRDVAFLDAWVKFNHPEITEQRHGAVDYLRLTIFAFLLALPSGLSFSLLIRAREDRTSRITIWTVFLLTLVVFDACHWYFVYDGNGSTFQLLAIAFTPAFSLVRWSAYSKHLDATVTSSTESSKEGRRQDPSSA